MGEVDHVHDAEHERQPGRHQEQHHAVLQPVQELLENQSPGHGPKNKGAGAPLFKKPF